MVQYRMCQGIMELVNALIYGDRLHCGSLDVANAKLKFSELKPCKAWLKEVRENTCRLKSILQRLLPYLISSRGHASFSKINARIVNVGAFLVVGMREILALPSDGREF